MRILLSCLQSKKHYSIPAYQYWEKYFTGGIEEGGHKWDAVDGVDWAEGLTYEHAPAHAAAWRERTWQTTVDWVRKRSTTERPDLFLSYLYTWMVDESAIRELRRLGVPCVNYFCDNVRIFTTAPEEFRPFDLNWVPELAATKIYARAGFPFVHAAMASWIPREQRTWDHAERFGVTFLGSRDSLREVLLHDAIKLGAQFEIFGAGWPSGGKPPEPTPLPIGHRSGPLAFIRNQWNDLLEYGPLGLVRKAEIRLRKPVDEAVLAPHSRPAVGPAEFVSITQGSRVVLGVNRYPSLRHSLSRPDTYSRARDVEAPMMGACYLTEWTPELETMYELGAEVETYRDAEELVEKIGMLEGEPKRRRSMRRAAQHRALTEHSVPRTLQRIAEKLGIASATTRS